MWQNIGVFFLDEAEAVDAALADDQDRECSITNL
jgi:hypothetical protein